MAEKFLKHKLNGRIYSYHKHLAENPDFYEVTEQQAYPERFKPKSQKGRKAKVNLETKEVPEPPKGNEDLDQELTKQLEKELGA